MRAFFKKRRRLVIVASISVIFCALVAWFMAGLERNLHAPRPSRLILDRAGRYLGEVPAGDGSLGYWPLPDRIAEKVLVATLQTEDRHFYEHDGVHFPSVIRAAYQNLVNGRIVSGASTISMQVARMQTPGPRTIFRKFKEAAEALCLVADHGHDRVLRHYLIIAPYGNRVHGIVRAARYYFDKPIEDLSWLQAAFLAGLPQAPGRMDPHSPIGLWRAKRRSRRILKMLNERGYLGDQELKQALASELRLVKKPVRSNEAMHAVLRWSNLATERSQPIIRATIDLDLQSRISRILKRNLARWRWLEAGNTAGMVIDINSGHVLAYVGSADYFDPEAHGAIDYVRVKRSPGSALKPFVYALALAQGKYTAASELPDIHVEFPEKTGQAYVPRNITHTFLGPMLFREALANSRNIPALRVLETVGLESALEFFQAAGVNDISHRPDHYGLGLVLGNLNVTLAELVGLYGVLANEGKILPVVHFLGDETDVTGARRVLPRDVAQMITHMLSDPVARLPSFHRGSALEFDYAVAIKTGTSQGYRDAWAVGFSDRLLVGVWLGNHDWRRMNHLGGLAGAAGALHEIMDNLMPGHEPHRTVLAEFSPPQAYTARSICPLSGKLAGDECPSHRIEYFTPGSEPFERCPYHRKVGIDLRNGLLAESCPPRFVEERVLLNLPPRYAPWARYQHLELAPREKSPLCGARPVERAPTIAITEPRDHARFLWDPDTPPEFSTIRLAAQVHPRVEEIVWIVDGIPVAKVGYPHEFRWILEKGRHVIEAALATRPRVSEPVTVVIAD